MRKARLTFGIAWGAVVLGGVALLQRYASTPGEAYAAPPQLADRTPGRPVVMLFVHERCPCTRATVRELARGLPDRSRADLRIVFSGPAGSAESSWTLRDTIRREFPEATVIEDPEGDLAGGFGAATSGHAVIYCAEGQLLYSGGLTPSRGHEGPSEGRRALAALEGRATANSQGPVFGCPILSDETQATSTHIETTPEGG